MRKRKPIKPKYLIVWGAISDGHLLWNMDPDYDVRQYNLYMTRREAKKTAQHVKRFRLIEEPKP